MSRSPELSRAARAYVGVIAALGLVVVGVSLVDLAAGRIDARWLVLAGLTALSALLTIRVPTVPATISVSETFVFTSLLMFGAPAAVLTVAIDGLVASLWVNRRLKHAPYKILFNVAAPPAAMWAAALICFELANVGPVIPHQTPVEHLLLPLFLAATLYFIFNSWVTAGAISLETRARPIAVWTGDFLWLAINYFGGASVAVLILLLYNETGLRFAAFAIVLPLLAIFYLTFRIAMGRVEDTVRHLAELRRVADERDNLSDQLREAQKMESIGRLAAGVAHDFNNLLAPILGYAEMLLDDMTPASPHREELQQIRLAAERARDLTRQLLAIGRKQILALKPVDMRTVIGGFEKLLRRTVRADIRIEPRLPESLSLVRADAGQMEQVLMNLAINAQDAMPDGGTLTLGVADVTLGPARAAELGDAAPGEYVALSVSDTGTGMDQATLARICEPFFTTKERGKGTGLGLSTVYGIVKQHGGHLAITSAPGRGSAFTIYLPRLDDTDTESADGAAEAQGSPRGTERILLVEDDESVRKMARYLLERQGYSVTEADSGMAGVRAAEERAPFDLLLTDMVMPDMNGRTLYERLAPAVPGLKVLFMSGYADDEVAGAGMPGEHARFIQKPFTSQALSRMVRDVLDGG